MNMYVFVRRFVIELRVFANVVQTRANQISGIPIPGFGISKRCMQMRMCGNTSGRVDTRRKRTNTEETRGNGGYPDDPPRAIYVSEGVTDSPYKSPNNKSIRTLLFAARL